MGMWPLGGSQAHSASKTKHKKRQSNMNTRKARCKCKWYSENSRELFTLFSFRNFITLKFPLRCRTGCFQCTNFGIQSSNQIIRESFHCHSRKCLLLCATLILTFFSFDFLLVRNSYHENICLKPSASYPTRLGNVDLRLIRVIQR